MRQIIIKHIIQLNQVNSLHQYKKRDTRILKSQRLKEVVEISQSMLKGDYEKLRTNRMISVENYKMAAIEKLNELTLNIFNINSEEGVLNLMN